MGTGTKLLPYGCFAKNKLKEVVIPEGVEELDEGVFLNNNLQVIRLPNSLKEIFKRAFE